MTLPNDSTIYEHARDYITGDVFSVIKLAPHGYGKTSPIPEDLSPYYPNTYRQYSPLAAWVLKRLYGVRVRRWLSAFDQPGTVLEIGCGDGTMLSMFQERGWAVLGTERTEDMAQAAREISGVPVLVGDVDTLTPDQKFDLIVLFQVLEHIIEPEEVLAEITKHLNPGGKALISVPNFASWQSSYGRDLWFHLDVPRHVNHFSLETMRPVLADAGMTVVSADTSSLEHDPYGWVQTVLNRLGFPQNRLTRLLIGMDRFAPVDVIMLPLAALIAPFGLLLALVSWGSGNGAIIHVMAGLGK